MATFKTQHGDAETQTEKREGIKRRSHRFGLRRKSSVDKDEAEAPTEQREGIKRMSHKFGLRRKSSGEKNEAETEEREGIKRRSHRFGLRRNSGGGKNEAEAPEPDAKTKKPRLFVLKQKLARNKVDAEPPQVEAAISKNADLERELETLRSQLHEALEVAQKANEVSGECRVRLSVLSEQNEVMSQRVVELKTETDDLRAGLEVVNAELEKAKSDLDKTKSAARELEVKLAKARRPFLGFGTRKQSQLLKTSSVSPAPTPPESPLPPSRSNSIDSSNLWYDRFCGLPEQEA